MSSSANRCYIIPYRASIQASGSFYVGKVQLELGNTASPWMPGNLLTYNQQTVETDTTGLYTAYGVKSRDTTDFYKGTASIKNTVNASNNAALNIYGYWASVVPNKTYLFQVATKASVPKNGNIKIIWYDSSNTNIGVTNNNKYFTHTTGEWQVFTVIGVAPSNGVKASPNLELTGAVSGDILWWDEAWLIEYPTDNINIRNQLSVPEIQGNLFSPNIATGGDVLNSTVGFLSQVGTSVSRITSEFYNGSGCIKVTSSGTTNKGVQIGGIGTRPIASSLRTYSISCRVKVVSSVATKVWSPISGVDISVNWHGGNSPTQSNVTGDWQYITSTFTTLSNTVYIYGSVQVDSLNSGDYILVDDIQLEEGSTATDWKYPSMGLAAEKPSVTVKTTLRDTKKSKNMLEPNVATGGDNNNSAFLFGNNNGPEIRTRDLSTMVQGSGSILCTMTATVGYQGLYAIFYNENNITTSTISCLPNTDYTFSAYVKVQSGKGLVLDLRTKSSTSVYVHNYYHYIGTGEWDRISITVNSGSNIGLSCLLTKENALVEAISFNTDCWQLEEGNIATEWEYPGAIDTNNIITTTNTNDTITTQETIKNTTNLILQEYSDVIQEILQTSCPIFLDDNFSGLEDLNTLSTLSLTEPLTITEETNTYVASGVYETADLSDKIILVNSLKMLEYPEILEDLSLYVHAFIDEDVDVLDKVLHPLLIKDRYVNIETELNEVIKMITEEDITVAFKTDKDVTILVGGKVND